MTKIKSLLLLSLMLLAAAGRARAADADQVDRAKRFLAVEERAKAILSFMHPTADYKSMELCDQSKVVDSEKRELKGWFCLKYRFNWDSLFGNRNYSYLEVYFDDRGKLHSLKAGKTSSPIAAFGAVDLFLAAIKDKLIDQFKDDPKTQKQIKSLIEDKDATGLLTYLLQIAQNMS